MPWFSFSRKEQYPDLDMEVSFRPSYYDRDRYHALITIKARGRPVIRERWRQDFLKWAASRDIQALTPRYGENREAETSVFDVSLRTWTAVADFLIVWVGEDAFRRATDETAYISHRFTQEFGPMVAEVKNLSAMISRLEVLARKQERRLSRVGLILADEEEEPSSTVDQPRVVT